MRPTRIRRAAALAAVCVLALGACSGDDGGDDGEGSGGRGGEGPAAESVSFETASEAPCSLITTDDAVTAVGEGAERTAEAPLCTYAAGDASVNLQVTQIVEGTTLDQLGAFVGVNGVGDAAGYETLDSADSGRLLAIEGGALLTLTLTRPGLDDSRIRVAISTLAKTLLSRLAPTEPLPAPPEEEASPPPAESCPLVDPEALGDAVGLDLELGPAGEGSCVFLADDVTLTVGPRTEGVTERQFDLGLANSGDAAELGFEIVEVEGVGDQAVLVRRSISDELESGQLSVLAGDVLLLVAADRVADSEALTVAAARAVLGG